MKGSQCISLFSVLCAFTCAHPAGSWLSQPWSEHLLQILTEHSRSYHGGETVCSSPCSPPSLCVEDERRDSHWRVNMLKQEELLSRQKRSHGERARLRGHDLPSRHSGIRPQHDPTIILYANNGCLRIKQEKNNIQNYFRLIRSCNFRL